MDLEIRYDGTLEEMIDYERHSPSIIACSAKCVIQRVNVTQVLTFTCLLASFTGGTRSTPKTSSTTCSIPSKPTDLNHNPILQQRL